MHTSKLINQINNIKEKLNSVTKQVSLEKYEVVVQVENKLPNTIPKKKHIINIPIAKKNTLTNKLINHIVIIKEKLNSVTKQVSE